VFTSVVALPKSNFGFLAAWREGVVQDADVALAEAGRRCAALGHGGTRDQGAEGGAATERSGAAHGALAQERHAGVTGDGVGRLADGAVGVDGFEIDTGHR
jgi:hypothetical protein